MVRKLTLSQAKNLKSGQTVYLTDFRNADGTAARCRVNGKVKTWKTRPDEVQVPIKRGMYEHGYITQDNLARFSLDEPAPVKKAAAKEINAARGRKKVQYFDPVRGMYFSRYGPKDQ